jgi:hypothetical protein
MVGLLTDSLFSMPSRCLLFYCKTFSGYGVIEKLYRASQQRDCTGFSPDSLLIRMAEEPFGTNSGTKIINIVMVTILRRFKNRELYYFIR